MSEEEKLLKEAKKLPWEDRLSHKNWKVRNEANIDLAALCDSISDPKDARIREFGECSLGFSIFDSRSLFGGSRWLRVCNELLMWCILVWILIFEFGRSFFQENCGRL